MAVVVFAAHPDDEVLGAGGTIAKYIREGRNVIIVIFSHGEGSDPLLDPAYLTERRIKESKRATHVLGCKNVIFLGLADLQFRKQIDEPSTITKVKDILKKYKPNTIFTHAMDDPHPAHRAVTKLIKKLIKNIKPRPQIYTFMISSPFRFFEREKPRLYIDVTKTFKFKQKALKMFKSQRAWLSIYYKPLILLQNWLAGIKAGYKRAEVFYKW